MESARHVCPPPFALLCQVILRVMELEGLKLLLVAPLWPQKEWFADLLVAELLELPRVWNFPAHPHVRKYHRVPETHRLHAWSLSSNLSERLDFRGKLCTSRQRTYDAPQLPSTSLSGPIFLVSVIQDLYSCDCGVLLVPVSRI